jgi:hypothetical protein
MSQLFVGIQVPIGQVPGAAGLQVPGMQKPIAPTNPTTPAA